MDRKIEEKSGGFDCEIIFEDRPVDSDQNRLFRFSQKKDLSAIMPEYQPDGQLSQEVFGAYIDKARQGEGLVFDWVFTLSDGRLLQANVRMTGNEKHVTCRIRERFTGRQSDEGQDIERLLSNKAYQERQRLAIENIPMITTYWDGNMNLIDCNEFALEVFGMSDKQEFIDRFYDLAPERQSCGNLSTELLKQYLKTAIETGTAKFDWSHHKSDGELIPIEVTAFSVKWQGAPMVIAFARDMRDNYKYSEEQRVSRERMLAMLDSSPMACFISDEGFNLLACNQSVVDLFEVRDKQEYMEKFPALNPKYQPDGRSSVEKAREKYDAVFSTKQSVHYEWMFHTINGKKIPGEVTLRPIELDGRELVIAYIHDLRQIMKAVKAAEQLQKLAYTDSLTGAHNRRYFMDTAKSELKKAIEEDKMFSLIMIDIDDFKLVNDTFGHSVGDEILKILVSRIRHIMRKDSAVVARYGGEEFILMMNDTSPESAKMIAERIRQNIDSSKFKVGDVEVPVTVSIGVASKSEDAKDLKQIINNADAALYEAKTGQKNTVVQYSSSE